MKKVARESKRTSKICVEVIRYRGDRRLQDELLVGHFELSSHERWDAGAGGETLSACADALVAAYKAKHPQHEVWEQSCWMHS